MLNGMEDTMNSLAMFAVFIEIILMLIRSYCCLE